MGRDLVDRGPNGHVSGARNRENRVPPTCLNRRPVERIWGRTSIPGVPGSVDRAPIGEVWFDDPGRPDPLLLVKYIFTAERLSIQVHPDDEAARARGLPRGKDEAWYILEAEPDAAIGLGLKRAVSTEALAAAALDGSIEQLIDWRPARAGELIYSPGGTIHAIGGGLALIEIQQNLDLTYRLYDYGRPRELHLADAVAVADPGPYRFHCDPTERAPGREVLVAGGAFVVERWRFARPARLADRGGDLLLIPIATGGMLDGATLEAGSVWRVEGVAELAPGTGLELLAAYPGGAIRDDICSFK